MDNISFGSYDIRQTYCGEFSGIVLDPFIPVSWSQFYALWVVFGEGLCLKIILFSWYASVSLLIAFFTLYWWWEFKLRYCPVKVDFRYIDHLNPCILLIHQRRVIFHLVLSPKWTVLMVGLSSHDQVMCEHLPDMTRKWVCHLSI